MPREQETSEKSRIVVQLERTAPRLVPAERPRTPAQAAADALASLFRGKRKSKLLAVAVLLAGITGCGSSANPSWSAVYPVKGKLLVDGKPGAGALLVLHAKGKPDAGGIRPRAYVGPDGSFELSTYVSNDGAPEGDYAVTIDLRQQIKNGNEAYAGPSLLPTAYSKPDTSPVSVRVAQGSNELPIVVKK